ncbi:MAG: GNAT family N-acetyltransferase [Ichthyobacteriaceae bacterium]|nr:GNAT family N-acetyltransferase [Ichthyobacteriaceae bacterium]
MNIRKAERSDAKYIHELITELAVYEKLEDEVKASVSDLEKSLFDDNHAEVLVAEVNGVVVAYAIYFYSYSTFLAKRGIYLEDLYVTKNMRSKGIGKGLLSELAKIAIDNNYGRLEWSVLNWNKPAIDFYNSIGAESLTGWTVNRLTGNKLLELSEL